MYCLPVSQKMLLSAALLLSVSACTSVTVSDADNIIADNAVVNNAVVDNSAADNAVPENKPAENSPTHSADNTAINNSDVDEFSGSANTVAAASVINATTLPSIKAVAGTFTDNTQDCPQQFYTIKLPNNGKLCQVFAAELPASMIFFVPKSPEEVVAFYQQDSANFGTSKRVKDRFLIQSSDKTTTLIISKDGQGTQVDILVKNT